MLRFVLACLAASQLTFGLMVQAHAETESHDDAWQALSKAAHAARELSYKGIFTHQTAGHMRSVEITHMNAGQGEYSHIVMLDGTPMEMLKQGQDVVIFNPQGEKVVIEKRRGQLLFPALLPANMDLIKSLYQAKLGADERIGGRLGQVVSLEPRDQYRYSYRIWVDKEFSLLLKIVTLNKAKQAIEQIAFNQISLLNTQNLDWFQPKIDQNKPYVMEKSHATQGDSNVHEEWKLVQIPAGYRQIDHIKRAMPSKLEANKVVIVNQLIFSDGLSSVSLFIENLAKGVRPKMGHVTVGATSFYANVAEGRQIIAVGEVPEATVAGFANAVSFNK